MVARTIAEMSTNQWETMRIRQSDVFACDHNEPPRDIDRILAAFQHPAKVDESALSFVL